MECNTCRKDLTNEIKYVDKWNTLTQGWDVYLCKEHYFMDLEYRHAFTRDIPKKLVRYETMGFIDKIKLLWN